MFGLILNFFFLFVIPSRCGRRTCVHIHWPCQWLNESRQALISYRKSHTSPNQSCPPIWIIVSPRINSGKESDGDVDRRWDNRVPNSSEATAPATSWDDDSQEDIPHKKGNRTNPTRILQKREDQLICGTQSIQLGQNQSSRRKIDAQKERWINQDEILANVLPKIAYLRKLELRKQRQETKLQKAVSITQGRLLLNLKIPLPTEVSCRPNQNHWLNKKTSLIPKLITGPKVTQKPKMKRCVHFASSISRLET